MLKLFTHNPRYQEALKDDLLNYLTIYVYIPAESVNVEARSYLISYLYMLNFSGQHIENPIKYNIINIP